MGSIPRQAPEQVGPLFQKLVNKDALVYLQQLSGCRDSMDLVTILTSVDTASKTISPVSTTLYKFIWAAKQVDKTVEALFDEGASCNDPKCH